MSRYKDLVTGKSYMTEKNALRHYLSKAIKEKKRNNYEEMWKLYCEATRILEIDYCYKCSMDDFGYCGLRRMKITDEERFCKYCFDGFIRDMKNQLESEG